MFKLFDLNVFKCLFNAKKFFNLNEIWTILPRICVFEYFYVY